MRLDRRIVARVSRREVIQLAGIAKRKGLSRSEVLRRLIRQASAMGTVGPGDGQGGSDEQPTGSRA